MSATDEPVTVRLSGVDGQLTSYGDPGFSRFLRRAFLNSAGLDDDDLDRPIIGIAHTSSDYTTCHRDMPQLVEAVRRGVLEAGGLPFAFPVPSLGEILMSPTTMLYRNLLALAVEELIGITVPRRCQVIRTILAEMSRLADHSLCVGAMTMDLGAFSSILWTFVEREKLYDVFEAVTGTRLTTSYTRVGGLAFDLPADFEKRVTSILDSMEETIDNLRKSFYQNRIFLDRTEGIGCISKEMAMSHGITGPMGRASGVEYDIRKFRPYLIYPELKFEVPVYSEGDTLARYKVRIDEMEQSIQLVRQAMKRSRSAVSEPIRAWMPSLMTCSALARNRSGMSSW